MVFKKGDKPHKHKNGCTCFRCSKIPWNKDKRGLPKHTEEHKKKISDKLKGRKFSREHRDKLSIKAKNKKLSDETKKKISLIKKENPSKYWLGKQHSNKTKRKISNSRKGKQPWNKGIPCSDKTKEKLRLAIIKYIKNTKGFMHPMIGRNEKQLLDKLEKKAKYKIIRQYKCGGYFLDGYIPELKLAIEVDEIPKNKRKDINRQKYIENKLNCIFLRIKDYKS